MKKKTKIIKSLLVCVLCFICIMTVTIISHQSETPHAPTNQPQTNTITNIQKIINETLVSEDTTEVLTEPFVSTTTEPPLIFIVQENTEKTENITEVTEPPIITPSHPPNPTEPVTVPVKPTEPPNTQPTAPSSDIRETISLGTFVLTAYCPCYQCCGKWSEFGLTATGTIPVEGRTIAVDPDVIPYGTQVIINGHTYIAEDCGSAIKENRIDIFFNSHEDALIFGMQTAEVKIIKTI